MNWKAKLNICTLTNQTAGKTWERITNIYHMANEVQKILLREMETSLNEAIVSLKCDVMFKS